MSVFDVVQLVMVIIEEDDVILCCVFGIGCKGVVKMILEFKDKVVVFILCGVLVSGVIYVVVLWWEQVVEGLVGLGWLVKDVEKVVDKVVVFKEVDLVMIIGNFM